MNKLQSQSTRQKVRNTINYNEFQYYLHAYKKASIELIKHLENPINAPKGTIINKNITIRKNNKEYSYQYKYMETTTYENRKKKNNQKYIPQKDLNEIEALLAKKKGYNQKRLQLTNEVKILKQKLQKFIKKGILHKTLREPMNWDIISKEIENEYSLAKSISKHRTNSFKKTINDANYKIITQSGDLVRSKNEAITASAISNRNIAYFYEKGITINSKDKHGNQRILKPDFTLFINNKYYYIEVLGMMNDRDYKREWEHRLIEYKHIGIEPGKNLICLECYDYQEFNIQQLNDVLSDLKNNIVPDKPVCLGLNNVRSGDYSVKLL